MEKAVTTEKRDLGVITDSSNSAYRIRKKEDNVLGIISQGKKNSTERNILPPRKKLSAYILKMVCGLGLCISRWT